MSKINPPSIPAESATKRKAGTILMSMPQSIVEPEQTSRTSGGNLALIIATRGRPQKLAEVFQSLKNHTARKDLTSLWLYVDEDDAVTRRAIEANEFPDPGFPVHWHIGPQTASLGDTQHALWQASGRTAQICMISVDDARFDTPDWDEVVRAKFAEFPDGVLLAFPHDPMTADTATYPLFGRAWLETVQYMFPGHFPYWFDDRWVSQIGQLCGRCAKLPILMYPIRGKGRTRRMRNLPFWTRFFQLTLDERKGAARKLIAAIHPNDEAKRLAALAEMETVAAEFAKEQETFSDVYAAFQEERHTDLSPEERQVFDIKYFRSEALAVARLIACARERVERKEHAEAMRFLDATQLSDIRVKQAQSLKAECLRALGRSAEAERIAAENIAAWPELTRTRRFFRFLGMVANDGKRLLVGLTEKGRKSPKAH
jgi:hypothetical protein